MISNTIIEELINNRIASVLGEAGTGKTTLLIDVVNKLMVQGYFNGAAAQLRGTPSLPFVLTSYTNAAVQRIKAKVPKDWPCMTIHKLLEFKPDTTSDDFEFFTPRRDLFTKIPGLLLIAIDEISMLDRDLYISLRNALPSDCLILLLGDHNQIPPVYGESIISHVISSPDVPKIYLTEQHRQSNGLLKLAHKILQGQTIQPNKKDGVRILDGAGIPNDLYGFKKVTKLLDSENFTPGRDILLCPMRTSKHILSCYHFSKWIADKALRARNMSESDLIEIQPFDGLYVALGDILHYQKEEWKLIEIHENPQYSGDAPAISVSNRYGHHRVAGYKKYLWEDLDYPLDLPTYQTWLSHILTLQSLRDPSETVRVTHLFETKLDDQLGLSGATTIHKSQGNEWDRVFLLTLPLHNRMCTKQLLYTAVTRAKHNLIWITSKGPLYYGIKKSVGYRKLNPNECINLLPREEIST